MVKNLFKKIIRLFRPVELYPEALVAYFHRLPKRINVSWFRDEEFIIGTIKTDDGAEFMTQGLTARDFVEMVNESIFVVYDIPEDYFAALGAKKFVPTREEFDRLNNAAIKKSTLQLEKLPMAA